MPASVVYLQLVDEPIQRAKQSLPPDQRRRERVPVMFTLAELEAIRQAAAQAGKTVSTFCRDAVVRALQTKGDK